MTAYLFPDAAQAAETAGTRAAALIAGPCALPAAPMAMPPQVLEQRPRSLGALFLAAFRPARQPSRGV